MRYIVSEGEKREKGEGGREKGRGERRREKEGKKPAGKPADFFFGGCAYRFPRSREWNVLFCRFFLGLREWKKEFLAPDICRGRNEYGGVYSAPRFPPFRRNLSFTENAGFCSSKLLRLVSPPTNVGGEEGTRLRIRCADSHLCEEAGVATPLRADEYAYCQKDFFAPMSFNVKSGC